MIFTILYVLVALATFVTLCHEFGKEENDPFLVMMPAFLGGVIWPITLFVIIPLYGLYKWATSDKKPKKSKPESVDKNKPTIVLAEMVALDILKLDWVNYQGCRVGDVELRNNDHNWKLGWTSYWGCLTVNGISFDNNSAEFKIAKAAAVKALALKAQKDELKAEQDRQQKACDTLQAWMTSNKEESCADT